MSTTTTLRLTFAEIEHRGDLETVISDLCAAGARIVSSYASDAAESARVTVEVADPIAFRRAFAGTVAHTWLIEVQR